MPDYNTCNPDPDTICEEGTGDIDFTCSGKTSPSMSACTYTYIGGGKYTPNWNSIPWEGDKAEDICVGNSGTRTKYDNIGGCQPISEPVTGTKECKCPTGYSSVSDPYCLDEVSELFNGETCYACDICERVIPSNLLSPLGNCSPIPATVCDTITDYTFTCPGKKTITGESCSIEVTGPGTKVCCKYEDWKTSDGNPPPNPDDLCIGTGQVVFSDPTEDSSSDCQGSSKVIEGTKNYGDDCCDYGEPQGDKPEDICIGETGITSRYAAYPCYPEMSLVNGTKDCTCPDGYSPTSVPCGTNWIELETTSSQGNACYKCEACIANYSSCNPDPEQICESDIEYLFKCNGNSSPSMLSCEYTYTGGGKKICDCDEGFTTTPLTCAVNQVLMFQWASSDCQKCVDCIPNYNTCDPIIDKICEGVETMFTCSGLLDDLQPCEYVYDGVGTFVPDWNSIPWEGDKAEDICVGDSGTRTKYDNIGGCQPISEPVVGTKDCCNWSAWYGDNQFELCFNETGTRTKFDKDLICPDKTEPVQGIGQPVWSAWLGDEASAICIGSFGERYRFDVSGTCDHQEDEPVTGTKNCDCTWGEWIGDDLTQICTSETGLRTRYATSGNCPPETEIVQGQKSPCGHNWSPDADCHCGGAFLQTSSGEDCCPNQRLNEGQCTNCKTCEDGSKVCESCDQDCSYYN